jgi:hypothetical protein
MRRQRGQTAAELVGVLLLVGVIVTAIATAGVGGRIASAIDAAVCQIAGGDCHTAQAKPGDRDGDGISDADERRAGTDPDNADSDADGIPDRRELELGTDPASADSDGDGVPDRAEATSGGKLDPKSADSDGDGLSDGEEVALGTDPSSKDSDGFDTIGDGLTDAEEIELGTDPNHFDSDGDGNPDGYEVKRGDDPTEDERSLLTKAANALVLDDPVSLLLPSGPLAKALGKGFERFAVAAKGAIKALREAKTLEEAAAARRRILAIWRSQRREVPDGTPRPAATPPPAADPERQELLADLARKLKRRQISTEQRDPDPQARGGPGQGRGHARLDPRGHRRRDPPVRGQAQGRAAGDGQGARVRRGLRRVQRPALGPQAAHLGRGLGPDRFPEQPRAHGVQLARQPHPGRRQRLEALEGRLRQAHGRDRRPRLEEPVHLHTLSGMGVDYSGQDMMEANLARADLREARLVGTQLQSADLRRADLSGADLTGANLVKAQVDRATLRGAVLRDANLRRATFNTADLSGTDCTGAELGFTALYNTDLSGARLDGARFYAAGFHGTRLHGASVRDLVDLEHAYIESIDVGPPGAPEILEGDAARAWFTSA